MDWTSEQGYHIFPMRSVWYYSLTLVKSLFMFNLLSFFLHYVPAFFVDIGLRLSGKKLRLTKIYNKIQKFMQVIAYFARQNWNYSNKNTQDLWLSLNEKDQKAFPFSMKMVDWRKHCLASVCGLRVFLLKEGWDNLPEARKRCWRYK